MLVVQCIGLADGLAPGKAWHYAVGSAMATGFDSGLNPPFSVVEPPAQLYPYIFNSPHSGRNYTPQFLAGVRLNRNDIRRSEDFRIDELFAGAATKGCILLVANFPRVFLDANREPYELDPEMFDELLPDFVNSRSTRVSGGLGTIARIVSENDEIYARKLTLAEAFERVDTLYKPYHACLGNLLARTHERFGYSVLVDCHSMPSTRNGAIRRSRPDFVIGDRYGTSCAQKITWAAAEFLVEMGYEVEINKPYAGGFITEHYGRPDNGLHAIQIEVNRGLYMNEERLEKNARFAEIARDVTEFIGKLVKIPGEGLSAEHPLAAE
jgi:N-formylglutamate amidohydrolase